VTRLLLDTHAFLWWLAAASAIVGGLAGVIESQGFVGLPITVRHGETAGALPGRTEILSIAC
jgi:hypothetical protein